MRMLVTIISSVVIFVIFIFFVLFHIQHRLIFFPQKLNSAFKFSFKAPFEERYFNTEDNVRIHALHFKVKNPRGVIYYMHGNAGSLQGWGEVASEFLVHQYDVLMIDYRGYGKSNGKISEKSLFKDAKVIYDIIKKEYDEQDIVVYGRSIGSGIATYVAAHNHPGLLILESPFYNLPDVARTYFPWFPSKLIRFKFRNDIYIKNVKCPVYIFHGTLDEVIDVKGSYKLKPLLKSTDQLFLIDGGHHNDLTLFDQYQNKIRKILADFNADF